MTASKARYCVTELFTVLTANGPRTFTPGTVLSLVPEKAAPFLQAGKLREVAPEQDARPQPAPGGGLLIPWRTATGRLIYLAESATAAAQTPAGGAAFQREELNLLRGATTETITMVINVKEVFDNPTLQEGRGTTNQRGNSRGGYADTPC